MASEERLSGLANRGGEARQHCFWPGLRWHHVWGAKSTKGTEMAPRVGR